MGFRSRKLAELSSTPERSKTTKAYAVTFQTSGGERGSKMIAICDTSSDDNLGNQVKKTLFSNHPDAVDYTFSEIDYDAFQRDVIKQVAMKKVIALFMVQVRLKEEGYI